jgi:thiamine biosynthesis lipoprotein
MTVPYRILIGKELSFLEKKSVQSLIDDTFDHIDATFNYWNPHSEISQLNHLKKLEKKKISAEMEKFLLNCSEIVAITEGRFDPTVRPLYQLWKKKLDQGQSPTDREIQELLPAIGWDKIHIMQGRFWKDHDETSLDLGGIAKGYCVDLIVEKLTLAGYQSFYVEWGGEIAVRGNHPENRPWRIFISKGGDPNPENALAIVELHDEAIATSGNYYQQWTLINQGKTIKYTHIIDPQTGYPLSDSISSASVVAPNCMLADGLATALMMPWEKTELPNVRYWVY